MIRGAWIAIALLIAAGAARAGPLSEASDLTAEELVARVSPCVVRIQGLTADGRGPLPAAGVVVGSGKLVLSVSWRTNPGRRVTVLLPDGARRTGEVIAWDRSTLATVVRLDGRAPLSGLRASETAPEVGSPVLAAGYPFGARRGDGGPAVGLGIVAQTRRAGVEGEPTVFLLSSTVNPGEVGGPLVDRHGRLAGLLLQRADPVSRLSRALPICRVREAFEENAPVRAALAPTPVVGDPAPSAWPLHDRLRQVVGEIRPAVVGLVVTAEEEKRSGTAVLIEAEGIAVTARDIVVGATEIVAVLADGREVPTSLIGDDERLGIALLRLDSEDLPLPVLLRADAPPVGTFVVAVGSPDGRTWWHTPQMTIGIVGARNRQDRRYGALHTDAAVNPGNAGGPLVDLEGRVVGFLSTLSGDALTGLGANSGLGFAIPVSEVRKRLSRLKAGERIPYRPGFLGVTLANDAHEEGGVEVTAVAPEQPAAIVGLEVGDVIVMADGQPITSLEDLRRIFKEYTEDQRITLVVRRGGEPLEFTPTLGKWPAGGPR